MSKISTPSKAVPNPQHHTVSIPCPPPLFLRGSINTTNQPFLQYIFPLFIFLRRLKGTIIFPTHDFFTLSTADIADYVAAGGHVSFCGFGAEGVDYCAEEVGFSMLASEIL
jgi:hypothetical protein